MAKSKREILQDIIDDVEEPWIIMKPSRFDPADSDSLCVFENPEQQIQAKTDIPSAWFENAEVEKIKEAVHRSLERGEVMYPIQEEDEP
jgi:hypothetical protein